MVVVVVVDSDGRAVMDLVEIGLNALHWYASTMERMAEKIDLEIMLFVFDNRCYFLAFDEMKKQVKSLSQKESGCLDGKKRQMQLLHLLLDLFFLQQEGRRVEKVSRKWG